MKLPLKCIAHAGHPERPAALEAPGQGFGSRSRAQLPPCPSEPPTQRPDGRVSSHGQPLWARGGGRTGAVPEVGEGCTPHSPGAEGAHSLGPRERRRCSDYLTLSEMCPQTDAQEAGASAPGQGAERAAGSAVRVRHRRVLRAFMCMDSTCVHGDTAQKDRHGEFTVESRQWVYECSPNMSFNFSLFGSFHKRLEDVNLTTVS